MKSKMIYEHARLHVDDDFPWNHARRWMNEALMIISSICDTGSVAEFKKINANKDDYYNLPRNTIKIDRVYKGEVLKENITNDFIEHGNRIYLKKGTYTIEYKRSAKEILRDSDEPEIHELYHLPISYWIASREKLRFNPDDIDGLRLENEFYKQIYGVDTSLKHKKRVRKIKV